MYAINDKESYQKVDKQSYKRSQEKEVVHDPSVIVEEEGQIFIVPPVEKVEETPQEPRNNHPRNCSFHFNGNIRWTLYVC